MNGAVRPSIPQGERLWSHPITLIRDEPIFPNVAALPTESMRSTNEWQILRTPAAHFEGFVAIPP